MTPQTPATLAILTLIACLAAGAVNACAASRQLNDFAADYASVLNTASQNTWTETNDALTQKLRDTDAIRLGRDLNAESAPADITRLARLLSDASSLLSAPWEARESHRMRTLKNLAYVDHLIAATDCDIAPILSTTPDDAPSTQDAANPSHSDAYKRTTRRITSALALLLALGLLIATTGPLALRHLRRFATSKASRTQRLKRHAAIIPVLVATTDRPAEVADTVDISLGGVKLAWKDAPPPASQITIDFGGEDTAGVIIWSNAFYAGVGFTALLTPEDLKAILARAQTTA